MIATSAFAGTRLCAGLPFALALAAAVPLAAVNKKKGTQLICRSP